MKFVISIFTLNLIVFVQCQETNRALGEKDLLADEESERITVCIDEKLGCFPETEPGQDTSFADSVSDWFENKYWRSSRERVQTEFHYWAPGKKQAKVITNWNFHEHIKEGGKFRPDLKTFFIIHGFHDKENPWMTDMKNALMRQGPCNVFLVNWNGGVMYGTARANTWVVGAELGRIVQRLGLITGMKADRVHIIGHSLGAHAAGFAGKWVQNRMGGTKVKRITGLDPAGPDFDTVVANERLDRNDAEFVDIIHSNFASSLLDGFGLEKAIGHFDFYPNGGEQQPGCPTVLQGAAELGKETLEYINPTYKLYTLIAGDNKNFGDAYEDVKCNHVRSVLFFIDSINHPDCHFVAEECGSYDDYRAGKCSKALKVSMGYRARKYRYKIDPNASKKFYLSTNAKAPFCKH